LFTITLTRQQLYELYYEGPEATIRLIKGLLEELADQGLILGSTNGGSSTPSTSVTRGRPRSSNALGRSWSGRCV